MTRQLASATGGTTMSYSHQRPGRWDRAIAAAALGCSLLAVAGCASSSSTKSASSDTAAPTVSATPTDADAAVKQQILAAYSGYRQEEVKIFASGQGNAVEQAKYSNKDALAQDVKALLTYQKAGVVFTGAPKLNPKVTSLDLAAKPAAATITECFNATNWKPIYKATGQSALTPGQPLKYVEVITAQQLDGSWKITEVQLEKDQAC